MAANRILIVDDEPVVLQVLRMALDDPAFATDTVSNAEEALARAARAPYDALIVDKNLPGMSGIALLRELRRRGDDAAALLITGYASAASAVEALNIGIDAYLEKPFDDVFAVATTVRRALEARQRRRRVAAALAPAGAPGGFAPLRLLVGAHSAERCKEIALLLDDRDDRRDVTSRAALLAALAAAPPDVLVLEGGPAVAETVEEVRRTSPALPCVVVAERVPLPLLRRLIELEVRAFIDGPLDAPDVRERIASALERYRGRKLGTGLR